MHDKAHSKSPRLGLHYIVYVGNKSDSLPGQLEAASFTCICYNDPLIAYANCLAQKAAPYAIICREDLYEKPAYSFISKLKNCPSLAAVPRILYNPTALKVDPRKARQAGAHDLYSGIFEVEDLLERLQFLNETKSTQQEHTIKSRPEHPLTIPLEKRLFDIVFSFLILLLISPLLLLIAVIIKLESGGPVLYISKRVGTGYRIFNFYKFRSMRSDADTMILDLMHLNQYQSEKKEGTPFIKFDNDPRVTPFGRFLRKTSLDELPQLFNVLLGDMSIVGNRPLPLYEARQITTDLWSKRFLAPAGITGLWQVSKRGKKDMSAEERIALDMTYADRCSLWYDLKIVALTFPAMLQKEPV